MAVIDFLGCRIPDEETPRPILLFVFEGIS
jgi:hypothetical protein